jgi:hypothetical protein
MVAGTMVAGTTVAGGTGDRVTLGNVRETMEAITPRATYPSIHTG